MQRGAGMTRKERAVSEFQKGYNCAQSVLSAFLDDIGLERETAMNLAGGLGGGLRMGGVCGAASGAVLALGANTEFSLEKKQEIYKTVKAFMTRFREENGSIDCRELLGYDFSQEGQVQAAAQSGRTKEVCPRLVASAVEILEDMLGL